MVVLSTKRRVSAMERLEDIIALKRIKELIQGKEEEEKVSCACYVVGIILAVLALVAFCYAVYKYFKPDNVDDFDSEFDDEFDDEFFYDDDEEMENGTGA